MNSLLYNCWIFLLYFCDGSALRNRMLYTFFCLVTMSMVPSPCKNTDDPLLKPSPCLHTKARRWILCHLSLILLLFDCTISSLLSFIKFCKNHQKVQNWLTMETFWVVKHWKRWNWHRCWKILKVVYLLSADHEWSHCSIQSDKCGHWSFLPKFHKWNKLTSILISSKWRRVMNAPFDSCNKWAKKEVHGWLKMNYHPHTSTSANFLHPQKADLLNHCILYQMILLYIFQCFSILFGLYFLWWECKKLAIILLLKTWSLRMNAPRGCKALTKIKWPFIQFHPW